jgi:hypothetical protein
MASPLIVWVRRKLAALSFSGIDPGRGANARARDFVNVASNAH